MTCRICRGSREVKVGWYPVNNIKIKVEYDPCPECTPGPHSFHAKQTADHIRAISALTPSRHPAGSPDLAGVNQSPVHQHTGGFDKGQTADQPALWPDTSRRAGNLAGAAQ